MNSDWTLRSERGNPRPQGRGIAGGGRGFARLGRAAFALGLGLCAVLALTGVAAAASWTLAAGVRPIGGNPAGATSPAAGQDDGGESRLFQLYDTQGARARSEEATKHIRASRWSEAIEELQVLLEEHRGEVLGASRPKPEGALRKSQQDVHTGAGSWALEALAALPDEAKVLYQDRFGRRADAALTRAILGADRGALTRVAQRWPLTEAAERAWWALGDLEIEIGNTADGARAWARAAAIHVGERGLRVSTSADWNKLAARVAESSVPGIQARVQLALDNLADLGLDNNGRATDEASFARGPASGIAAESIAAPSFGGTPGRNDAGAGWPRSVRLPDSPFRGLAGAGRLFPARLGDTVFVNTSRSLHAIDAFAGTVRWSLDPSDIGWDSVPSRAASDFKKAVDRDERIVTVAASDNVVVGAFQIPSVFEKGDTYQDLSIIRVIPERRLIAFDATTGVPLWDTLPPYAWDGDSGTFRQRMTVVGPPTVVGARVIVPMARLRGRIELHLGCFDLGSGDLLWSSPIVTGQRTLNMFGRADIEFSCAAPVVAGDTVILNTQLGLVAGVDLFTGETRWDTLYEQVAIHSPRYFQSGWMAAEWHNATPIVVGDTVVVAPFDGTELFALDVPTGATLWSIRQSTLEQDMTSGRRSSRFGLDTLVAADERSVLLSGSRVVSVEFPRGLRAGPPYRMGWAWPIDTILPRESGYPVVDAEKVYIPTGAGVRVVDRSGGSVIEDLEGGIGGGQLLVSGGMLFATDGSAVDARFEWAAMVDRAREAVASGASAGGSRELETLARLLLERAEALLSRNADVDRALALTTEAEEALERYGPGPGTPRSARAGLILEQHRARMLRARGERLRGDVPAARRAIEAALADRPPPSLELEALLVLHEVERSRSPVARRAVLDRLIEDHATSKVMVETRATAGRWTSTAALTGVLDALRAGKDGRAAWSDPWVGPLVPSIASSTPARPNPKDSDLDARRVKMTAGLFARISEVEMGRGMGGLPADLELELTALHAILKDDPEASLFGATGAEWATARVLALRALDGTGAPFRAFDEEAAALFARARTLAATKGATDLLERVPTLYPGSPSAREAEESRIEFALNSGSPREVASIVVGALSPDWHPGRSSERETTLLLQLAETLGAAGNTALRAGIANDLAVFSPGKEVDLPPAGTQSLGDLARQWQSEHAEPGIQEPEFDSSVVLQRRTLGDFTLAERIPADPNRKDAPGPIAIFAADATMLAVESGRSGVPLWSRTLETGAPAPNRDERVVLAGDRLIVAASDEVLALDITTGRTLWNFERRQRDISGIAVEDGVVVVVTQRVNPVESGELHGLDSQLGIQLWQLGSISGRYHSTVRVGSGRLVLLPTRSSVAAVHDLFTGHPIAAITTGIMNRREAEVSWIEGGRLVTAEIEGGSNPKHSNAIVAYGLDDGREAWRIDLNKHAGGAFSLKSVIEMPSPQDPTATTRIVALSRIDRKNPRNALRLDPLGLYLLNERLGALDRQPLDVIESNSVLLGIPNRRRVRVDGPLLIAITERNGSSAAIVRAIHPRLGVLWRTEAARNIDPAGASNLSPAAHGDGVLAMLVRERFGSGRSASWEVKLMFLDRATGRHVETRPLESGLPVSNYRDVVGFGGTLAVAGGRQLDLME